MTTIITFEIDESLDELAPDEAMVEEWQVAMASTFAAGLDMPVDDVSVTVTEQTDCDPTDDADSGSQEGDDNAQ